MTAARPESAPATANPSQAPAEANTASTPRFAWSTGPGRSSTSAYGPLDHVSPGPRPDDQYRYFLAGRRDARRPTPSPDGQGLWGDVTCEQSAAGCELHAGSRESAPTAPRSTRSAKPAARSQNSQPVCMTYPEVTGALRDYWVLHHGLQPTQRLILRSCQPGGPEFIVLGLPNKMNEPAVPDPTVQAASTRDKLVLPAPGLGISPIGDQLVGLPMWLWIDPVVMAPVSASTQCPV